MHLDNTVVELFTAPPIHIRVVFIRLLRITFTLKKNFRMLNNTRGNSLNKMVTLYSRKSQTWKTTLETIKRFGHIYFPPSAYVCVRDTESSLLTRGKVSKTCVFFSIQPSPFTRENCIRNKRKEEECVFQKSSSYIEKEWCQTKVGKSRVAVIKVSCGTAN